MWNYFVDMTLLTKTGTVYKCIMYCCALC